MGRCFVGLVRVCTKILLVVGVGSVLMGKIDFWGRVGFLIKENVNI